MKKYLDVLIETLIGDESKIKVRMDAASAIIYRTDENDNNQILLIQRAKEDRWPNHWEAPRGKCDKKGESIQQCLHREVKEETGLDVEIVGYIDNFKYLADRGTRLTTCHNYLCKMKNPNQKVKLSFEHQDYRWISEIGQIELMVMPDQLKTIEKVLNKDRSIINYPENSTSDNNMIEEWLNRLQN